MCQKRHKILELYTAGWKEKFYLREISRLTDIPVKTTERVVKELVEENILKTERKGRNKYFHLDLENSKTFLNLCSTEIWKTIRLLESYDFFDLFIQRLEAELVVLFGSFAKLEATEESDLDILSVDGGDLPRHLCPPEIHHIEMSSEGFEEAISSKESLIKEIVKNHIVLRGHSDFISYMEEYYGI